jgi:teichoic acid transport system ATP-binding protein
MTASETAGTSLDRKMSVRVQGIDAHYKVYEDKSRSVLDFFRSGRRKAVDVHALKNVSFDVAVGESVGVVGLNGSGKSTLLRAIAGIQPVTNGRVLVRGEAHLLGVGAALKPLLSGHRNILLGGLAMGLTPAEVTERIDDVIEFAALADSINLPMNTYSSGMRSRLAFAIATLRVPEVLLVDEALAVGDKMFRERSLERLRQIRDEAGAVLLVTHNLNEIRETCSRAIWIDHGELCADGEVTSVLDEYEASGP